MAMCAGLTHKHPKQSKGLSIEDKSTICTMCALVAGAFASEVFGISAWYPVSALVGGLVWFVLPGAA